MTPTDRKKIQTISINREIPKGPIHVVTMGQALTMGISGALGGAVGGGVAGAVQSSTPNEPAARTMGIIDKNGIEVETLIREEFIKQASARHLFKVAHAPADGEIKIIVPTWGIMVPSPYQSALRPFVMVSVILKDASGRVLWKDVERSSHLNFSVPRHSLEEFEAKPELLRDGLRDAAVAAVAKLMDNYSKQ